MVEKDLDELYDRVEYLENRVEKMDFIIGRHEVVKEAYNCRIPRVEESKEKIEWLLKVNDYLNKLEKFAIRARYWKSIYEEDLAAVKTQIEEILGG